MSFPSLEHESKTDQCLACTVLGFLDGHTVLCPEFPWAWSGYHMYEYSSQRLKKRKIWRVWWLCLIEFILGSFKSWEFSPIYSSLRSEQLMIFCPFERQASLFPIQRMLHWHITRLPEPPAETIKLPNYGMGQWCRCSAILMPLEAI